ncbi:hypothetical protein J437_LFUL010048 [Ladona fulva]|uniref:Mos1 transposase HTH domain-containing protein n=1 Tax=Ladona fulva TaxID=123851 RepID=A0A8K0P347_LADFU|nr:hypothetical protein J437_LFUL010048 [Ladona fulva]
MEVPVGATVSCEIRSVIRIVNAKKVPPIEIHRQLCNVYGEKCMYVQHVRKWWKEFTTGRTDIHDEDRCGRPSISDEIIEKVEKLVLEDRRVTIRELALRDPTSPHCARPPRLSSNPGHIERIWMDCHSPSGLITK